MSYYHYTSLEALNGILQNDKASKKRLCFWATRYDCFEDKEEYLLGIDCLGKCLSDLEEHYNLQEDRRIAANFKRELIAGKKNLPFPYVVSITSRNDNLYMWENYANHNNGVVLENPFYMIWKNVFMWNLPQIKYFKNLLIPPMLIRHGCFYQEEGRMQ